MQLLVAHQVLIAAAIALATIFGLRSAVLFSRSGGGANAALALASALVVVGLVLYFRTVRAKWRTLKRP
jgi:ABC-type dipeptide/oligopeptide/nickel transport system permease subunit